MGTEEPGEVVGDRVTQILNQPEQGEERERREEGTGKGRKWKGGGWGGEREGKQAPPTHNGFSSR